VPKPTNISLWRVIAFVPVVGLTATCYPKEVGEPITAGDAALKSSTLSGMAKMCVWLGAVTLMNSITRYTTTRCSCPVIGLADIATVSTQNT